MLKIHFGYHGLQGEVLVKVRKNCIWKNQKKRISQSFNEEKNKSTVKVFFQNSMRKYLKWFKSTHHKTSINFYDNNLTCLNQITVGNLFYALFGLKTKTSWFEIGLNLPVINISKQILVKFWNWMNLIISSFNLVQIFI